MNKQQRKKVTEDQVAAFFSSYYTNWRLHQILTNEKLLKEKFSFYSSIIQNSKQLDDETGDSTIAQEITNGLLFESISYCIQYIEDLFALIKAGENKELFIKNIITYDAGKINNFIKQKLNIEQLCKCFHFPYFTEELQNKETDKTYRESIDRLHKWTVEFKEFHSQHNFFYTQYKHGLTVALRPLKKYTDEQIQKSKEGNFEPYLAAFDNLALEKLKDKKDRLNGLVFMPNLTEDIQHNIVELMSEDNLIRYVFPPKETDMELIKSVAYKVRDCIHIIANNIIEETKNENDAKVVQMQMPASEIGKVVSFTFTYDGNKPIH